MTVEPLRSSRPAGDVIRAASRSIDALLHDVPRIEAWATEIVRTLSSGGLVLAAGNGGSATHASHLVGELVGRFRTERRALRAVSLVADHAVVTATANDYGFEEVFARQVTALASPGDVLVLFSTSGRSPNVIRAARAARRAQTRVFALTGPHGSPLASVADDSLAVADADTAAIQDTHHVVVHALCAEIDDLITTSRSGAQPTERTRQEIPA
jgi:phosphoheptose isomerase